MPPSSQSRASGFASNSTTIAIVLVLVIPTVLLLGLCVARRMPWFEPIRRRARAVAPRFRRQPGAAGPESLQKLPVIKYDEKLFNADPEGAKSEVGEDGTTAPGSKHRLRNLVVYFHRMDWPLGRFKGPTLSAGGVPKTSMSPSVETSSESTQMRKLAMQACAICTEDFCRGTNVRKLPCGHIFHPRCIDPWLVNFAATCPLCRIDLSVKEAASRVSKPRRAVVVAPMSDTTMPPTAVPPQSPPVATPGVAVTATEEKNDCVAENAAPATTTSTTTTSPIPTTVAVTTTPPPQ